MTDHQAHIAENIGVPLVTATIGMFHYMATTEVAQALMVAGAAGLVGGLFKGVGHWAWRKLAKRFKLEHHDEPKDRA